MKTINIKVNDRLATKYALLSKKEKEGISNMFKEILEDTRSLREVMEDMGSYAKKQGLTPDKLDDILNERDE